MKYREDKTQGYILCPKHDKAPLVTLFNKDKICFGAGCYKCFKHLKIIKDGTYEA